MATAPVPPTSRYSGIEVVVHVEPDGREVAHLRRRFCPHPEDLAQLAEHVVLEGDRLDVVAAREVGDPEQFWRIADANRAIRPDELTVEPGRRLRVCAPEGFPGLGTVGGPL